MLFRSLFSVLTLATDWIATTPAGDERVTQEIIAVFTHGQFFSHFRTIQTDASAHPRLETGASGPPIFPRPRSGSPRTEVDVADIGSIVSSADRQGSQMGSALATSAF